MIRYLLAGLCITLSQLSHAVWDENWLMGGSVGIAERSGHVDAQATRISDITELFNAHAPLKKSGLMWQLLGGYQVRNEIWLLGVELQLDWYKRHSHRTFDFVSLGDDVLTLDVAHKSDMGIGLSGRLGYQISYFMPYVRFGVQRNRDHLHLNLHTALAPTLSSEHENRRSLYRNFIGIGLEVPVAMIDGFSVRFEYEHFFRGRNVEVQTSTPELSGFALTRQKLNTGIVSFIYNFL